MREKANPEVEYKQKHRNLIICNNYYSICTKKVKSFK